MSMDLKRALVTGFDGQDGYYLARCLLARGVDVYATTRSVERIAAADIVSARGAGPGRLEVLACDMADPAAIDAALATARPQAVYHLAAQSSVQISWQDPLATARTNAMGTLHLLEALRRRSPETSLVLAGSCECYDHAAADREGVTPATPLVTSNPYAVTKVMAQQMVQCYRAEFGLRASVGILFNHTSPRRHERYLERGLVRNAVRVSMGLMDRVPVGSLEIRRDWAWASELMEAFAAMGELDAPEDLVLASGRLRTSRQWVEEIFSQLGLDMDRHMSIDTSRLHKGDRPHTFGNIDAMRRRLGWTPRIDLSEMVRRLIEYDQIDLQGKS